MHYDSALTAMEALAKNIKGTEEEAKKHIANIKNVIFMGGSITIEDAAERYFEYIQKSKLSKNTIKGYTSAINKILELIDSNKTINYLAKEDAIIARDSLMDDLSYKRLNFCFQSFRTFLHWCTDEGLANEHIANTFIVQLGIDDSENTPDIPVTSADQAMKCVPEWTLAPRIARYTGMRLNEACKMWNDCVTQLHGIWCFNLDRWTKTKTPRLVPIADKLIPYVINQDLSELKIKGHKNDKYNRKIKNIAGCEKCKFHSWRTYANTRMMEAGVDKAVRMKILGHKAKKDDIHTGYTAVQFKEMKKAVDLIP